MSAHDGAVDHRVLVVGVRGEEFENPLPDSFFRPSAETSVGVVPVAEPLGEVPPGHARPISIKHRIDKKTVVHRRRASMPVLAREHLKDPLPLIIAKSVSSWRRHGGQPSKLLTLHES
jgi:hypothetical protein